MLEHRRRILPLEKLKNLPTPPHPEDYEMY